MINDFFAFLNDSPVNFLACSAVASRLDNAGFRRLDPGAPWPACHAGDKFYVTKNDSSIYAFHIGTSTLGDAGFHLICAHCDSPTFRIKPRAVSVSSGRIVKLGVEAYGGVIMSTWFDRPLSIAGRVILKGPDDLHPVTRLLHIRRPIMTIPNLCIHFNRQVNDGVKLSVQKEMQPICGMIADEMQTDHLLPELIAESLGVERTDILDFDLCLYDTTQPCTFGLNDEYISAGRLDDLEMVYAGLKAMVDHAGIVPQTTQILAVFDNEETGSHTKQGAASPFLANAILRIVMAQGGSMDDYLRSAEHAFMISADNAHAFHPNYGEKYDPSCHPVLGGGPAIKYNAAQKYASDAASAAVFANLCKSAGVPYQRFVNHSDIAGGSTLGNILTSSLPVNGVDMGCAILAMHSVRETGSVADLDFTIRVFGQFFGTP